VNAVNCNSYTREYVQDEIYRSIHFPGYLKLYFLFDFMRDDHLIAGFASRYFGDAVLRLVRVVVIIVPHY